MEVCTGSLSFSRGRGSPQPRMQVFNFDQPVKQAVAILTGMQFGFSPNEDRDFGRVNVCVQAHTDGDVVIVEGTLGVRDWSDDWDDDYEGNLQFLLLAELDGAFRRANLAVTGIERTQAIQCFRSQDHLDPATAGPDNSIPQFAGKDTVFRVYVDTRSDASLPTIVSVSGVLSVRLPGSASWVDLKPLNAPIRPIRSVDIDRRRRDDTLNFLLPGAFAGGKLDIKVRVFDGSYPDVPGYTSASVLDTVAFAEVEPLRVRGIGVTYTGAGMDLAAPPQSMLEKVLDRVQNLFPVGRAIVTGFDAITFGGDLTSEDGQDDLLDAISDMHGDSEDLYYGVISENAPSLDWAGQANRDGRSAVGKVDFPLDGENAAHEIAHVFGRKHTCGDDPLDSAYPVYAGFPRSSIGEIGIDPEGNPESPDTTLDFMAQFVCGSGFWVSPYTYLGLRHAFPSVRAANILGFQERMETLFLNFRIRRGKDVEFRPSFHFPARPRHPASGEPSPYSIEFRARDGQVLAARRIAHTDPVRPPDAPFLSFYKPFPFPIRTAEIAIMASDCSGQPTELAKLSVPCRAPSVRIVAPRGSSERSGCIDVAWEACEGDGDLTYLLRYSNDCGRHWRAVAPRLKDTHYTVDLDRFPGGAHCQFQILCTSGVRTGSDVSEPFSVPLRRRRIEIVPLGPTTLHRGAMLRLRAAIVSPDSEAVRPAEITWESDRDGRLGPGVTLATKSLSLGRHVIRVRTPDGLEGTAEATLTVDVTRMKHNGSIPPDSTPEHRHGDRNGNQN